MGHNKMSKTTRMIARGWVSVVVDEEHGDDDQIGKAHDEYICSSAKLDAALKQVRIW